MNTLNETHDPALRSWVPSANEPACDFPIQNLPFGTFSHGTASDTRVGVAIGDQILDLRKAQLVDAADLNDLMAASPEKRAALRMLISQGLAKGSARQAEWVGALVAQSEVRMHVPCRIGDYTDFYTGINHATTVGKLFRPDQPLMPNYKWVPIGYHGRASSIRVSGQQFRRPYGQTKGPEDAEPKFGPSKRLDYEVELGFFVGQGNELGAPIGIESAEDHLFGVTLFNDWSARDIQAWEYQPLGPFLSKNFASTISPWIVTMDALAPFREPFSRVDGDPQPLAYLDGARNRANGLIDITLEVYLQTEGMKAANLAPVRLTKSNAKEAAYWTAGQLISHHTVNGCNLQPGDLLGSGTLSGKGADEAGSLLELTLGGKKPIQLSNGETRTFLEDGDTLTLRGYCERPGRTRIGLGEVSGTVRP